MQSKTSLALAVAIACGAVAFGAWAQDGKTLTARELFYAGPASAPPAKHARAKAPKKTAAVKPAAQPDVKSPAPAVEQDARPAPTGSAHMVAAAYTGEKPLGLRYSLLRETEGGEYREVDADTIFHSGDRIRVSVEANDAAYLYIVMKGSSGTWKVHFPSAEISAGSNYVEAGRQYLIPPPPGRFAFDEQPGDERLFIVLSRKPEPSLEELIYSLGSGKKPAGDEAQKKELMAKVEQPIDDSLVGRLRNTVLARDLVFEKVDDATPGDRKEKAVYVVNPGGGAESRLVADLVLKHR